MPPELSIVAIIVVLGACFGSFITAASWRLPRSQDTIAGASRCPACGAKLGVLDLVPVLSWLFSSGKCRHCKTRISVRYVLTELATALIFLGLYAKFGLGGRFVIFALLATSLLILIVSDFETYIMPDSTTIAALILGLVYHYLYSFSWLDFALGFAGCLLIALILRYGFYFICRREGLGMGDVKFLPVAGLWIGFTALPVYFVMAGMLGIITAIIWKIAFKNPEYPFGPALAVAMFLLAVFPELGSVTTVSAFLQLK